MGGGVGPRSSRLWRQMSCSQSRQWEWKQPDSDPQLTSNPTTNHLRKHKPKLWECPPHPLFTDLTVTDSLCVDLKIFCIAFKYPKIFQRFEVICTRRLKIHQSTTHSLSFTTTLTTLWMQQLIFEERIRSYSVSSLQLLFTPFTSLLLYFLYFTVQL